MPDRFQIIDIPAKVPRKQEQMGTKPKFWFEDKNQGYCLYKEGHQNTGEDWAEQVANELCRLLEIPHAVYQLAVWQDKNGIITPNFVCENETLVPGNEVLFSRDENYPKSQRHKVKQHTVEAIIKAFKSSKVRLPKEPLPPGITTAAQVFVGYLMLDAWIGNTDRHHENWALIQFVENAAQIYRLAPTHDHAASFGCILRDEERLDRLTTKDRNRTVAAYAAKGRSALYASETDIKPLLLISAFQAASSYNPDASKLWLNQLENVRMTAVKEIFERIPHQRISDLTKKFAIQLLEVNHCRLLESKQSN